MVNFVTPWNATAALTSNVAPVMGATNRYNVSSGGYTVTLPALSSLNVGARTIIEKDALDASSNLITVNRAGADTFDDGSTSFTVGSARQQETVQVVQIAGVKYWKRFSGGSAGGGSGGGVTLNGVETLSNKTLVAPKFTSGGFIADNNGAGQLFFATVPSAVNALGVNNAATGNPPALSAVGADPNIDFYINAKGVGRVFINGGHRAISADEGQTLTNKRITPRVLTTTSSATPSINTDITDIYLIQALAVNITSMTTGLTGSPGDGDKLWIAITGTATRTITWGAKFVGSTVALPTTTSGTARLDVGLIYDFANSVWRCVAVA